MESKYMLETIELCRNFKHQEALKNVSIHVPQNSIYGLLGPNGAGKSTLLKIISGMLRADKGQVIFDGHIWERKDLNNIGTLIENAPLYENLSARESLKVRTTLLGIKEKRIDEVLEIVNLKNTGNKKAAHFSMGMKQRLGIAIALINNPKFLILDEPTNGLDPMGIQELRELVKSFPKKGITVILSSHILSEVEQIADNIGIISGGVLGYEGKLEKGHRLEEVFMKVVSTYRRGEE